MLHSHEQPLPVQHCCLQLQDFLLKSTCTASAVDAVGLWVRGAMEYRKPRRVLTFRTFSFSHISNPMEMEDQETPELSKEEDDVDWTTHYFLRWGHFCQLFFGGFNEEKYLVVHSHPTPIPPLSTWTNNVKKIRVPLHSLYYLSHYWST
jgi:hypothetical protein